MLKKKGAIYLILFVLFFILILTSCEPRKGTLNANARPSVTITNYFGADDDSLLTEAQLFQQTIQWSGIDSDGVVEGYAYRILNEDEEPIATAGNDVITDPDGWVKFYTPSADLSIPLDQSAQTTIWIDQSYTTVNFPAADANGDSANVVSIFEVKCIDNGGLESEIARKYFSAYSHTPRIFIGSTKGEISGETISTAIIFKFTMHDDDPYVGAIPYYFQYKLEKRDLSGEVIPEVEGGYPDQWETTYYNPDINLSLHSAISGNPLLTNTFVDDVAQDSTFLIAKAVDAALISSMEKEISFLVKDGFYPGTIIYYGEDNVYANAIKALGVHHFSTYIPDGTASILPSVQTSDGTHYATSFWYDSEEKYTAIGSEDLKVYVRWGYKGEFEDNHPFKQRYLETLDELTGQPYYCEIVAYDLRLDGEPYYYPPLPAEGDNLQIDDDGTEWLRVGVNYAIGQKTTITRTSCGGTLEDLYGEHTFEVRAVDMQGAVDLTPDEFTYNVVPPVPKAEKSGILIIDDDGNNQATPAALVDSLYNYFVSDYTTDAGYINRKSLNEWFTNDLHMIGLHDHSLIATNDIQNYKAIIYHSDNGAAEFDFWKEFETFKIYLNQGGHIILSAGGSLKKIQQNCNSTGFTILHNYFGIPITNANAINRVSSSYTDSPFFIKAVSENSFNDLDLMLPSFNTTITNPVIPQFSVNGLGPVALFNDFNAEEIFSYGCKPVDEDPPGQPYHINPTQEEYDQLQGQSIGLKYTSPAQNVCYVFSFPLSYMDSEQVKTMMTQLLNDLP
ncbi:MAG: hypothetical protein K9N07_09730 [Candidatus Cloacimonetes bacterium]|nr:hypothetical protein [Candidatus Cloacimonadota bacterium]